MALRGSTSRHCYAVGCTNGDYRLLKWKQKMCEVHKAEHDSTLCNCSPPFMLFTFPTEKKNPEGRNLWIKALCRATSKQNPSYLEPKRDHRVCSEHFVDGRPSDAHPYPELNLGYDIKKRVSVEETERGARYQKRANLGSSVSDNLLEEPEDQASSNLTEEASSPEEGSPNTVFDYKIKNEKSDEVAKETENTFVKIKTEKSVDSTKDGIFSKFIESDDENVDYSEHQNNSFKKEPKHELQQTNSGLQVLSVTREAVSPEKESSFVFFDFKIKKEKYDEVQEETEDTFANIKTEQSVDSTNDGIISKFSESDDETVDCLEHNVMSLKTEKESKEEFQQITSVMESLTDPKTYRDDYSGKQLPGHDTITQKSLFSKSKNYKSLNSSIVYSEVNMFDKTLSRVNNQKRHNFSHSEVKSSTGEELERNHHLELNVSSHFMKKQHRCVVCGKQFVANSYLKIHLRTHTGEKPYRCVVCDKQFVTNSNLKIHLRTHTGKKSYTCISCDKKFMSKSYLNSHVRTHTGEKPYSCLVCNKQFGNNGLLKQHERVHAGEKPHSCVVCGKQFVTNRDLKIHLRIHTGEKPYKCVMCDKQFVTNSNLKTHLRTHTGEKPHTCIACDKKFRSKSHLNRHEKIHTGEKPYNCVVCERKFVTNSYLQDHMRIHTGEKPFSCEVCNKRFRSNSLMKKHEKVHTGEKPYSCTVCGRKFTKNYNLKMHQKIHAV